MAAVFVPPSPQTSVNMSTRRPPLANVPNATNSPHRPGLVPTKRSRAIGSTQIDVSYGQPLSKKHVVDGMDQDSRSPPRAKMLATGTDAKVFSRRSNNTQPSAFERKLVAVRDKERQLRTTRPEKTPAETLDTIRQWQRHYRRAFPQFVFYFDSIPEDSRSKCSRQVLALGAVSLDISFLQVTSLEALRMFRFIWIICQWTVAMRSFDCNSFFFFHFSLTLSFGLMPQLY